MVSLPALECLKSGYYEIWTAARTTSLIRFADRTRSIASTGLDMLELGQADSKLIESLRSFDSIVSWYGANREEFRSEVRRPSRR
jgi:heptosyltransferase III